MQDPQETTAQVADTATGVAVETAETVAHPDRRVHQPRRTGGPINHGLAKTARGVLDGTIPQRVARDGLRLVKDRARRHDAVGDATHRALELVSDGLGAASRALGQLGEATQPPTRGAGARPAAKAPASPGGAAATRTARRDRKPASARGTA